MKAIISKQRADILSREASTQNPERFDLTLSPYAEVKTVEEIAEGKINKTDFITQLSKKYAKKNGERMTMAQYDPKAQYVFQFIIKNVV